MPNASPAIFARTFVPALVRSVVLTAAAVASADTVWVGETANPIPAAGVTITGVDGDSLVFQTPGGRQTRKPLSQVQQLAVDTDPTLTAAEAAFKAGNFAAATDGYSQVLHGATKPWIVTRAASRLAVSAEKANRYDAGVEAYLTLLKQKSPLAPDARPAAPVAGESGLAGASTAIDKALDDGSLSDAGRAALFGLALDVARAADNKPKIDDLLSRMSKLNNLDAPTTALVKLAAAHAALEAKNFPKALSEVNDNRGVFTQPAQQADALYVLAAAKDGQLSDAASPDAIKDVALGYMRSVAIGKDLPAARHTSAASLLRVAQLEEKLGETKVAATVYQQLATEFPADPAAADARSALSGSSKSKT